MTTMRQGRQDGTDRRRQRVAGALKAVVQNGSPISVSAIARQAGVDCTFLYRHRDLLALVHAAELEPAAQDPAGATPVRRASLQADLANAQARNTRLVTRFQQLEKRPRHWGNRSGASPASVPPLTSRNSSGPSPAWNSRPSISRRFWRSARANRRLPGKPTGS
ncbi:hypothetical protein [Streptomyces sp. NPDC017435]|uniref:hypothetical protein n=1 Tax=Streptomyces sp. NPDC017435 TaxID=3364995 RepID=UPI0037B9FFEE